MSAGIKNNTQIKIICDGVDEENALTNVLETFNKLKGTMKPEEWKTFAESISTITHTHPNANGLPSKEDLETVRDLIATGDFKNLKQMVIAGQDFMRINVDDLDNGTLIKVKNKI